MDYRSGVDKDLDNILQIPSIFLNISKGQTAPRADLTKAFPKMTDTEIIEEILEKGDLQVGEKERQAQLDRVRNEVIDLVAGMVVDPKSKRVYTPGMIEKALDQLSSQSQAARQQPDKVDKTAEALSVNGEENQEQKQEQKPLPKWTGVVAHKPAKAQALAAAKALVAHQPISVMRARMRLRVVCHTSVLKHAVKSAPKAQNAEDGEQQKAHGTIKDTISSFFEQTESQDISGDEWEIVGFVEPGTFKTLGEFVGSQTKGRGRVEVLDTAIVHED
jgi:ribosome maturation protein SDO1